MKFKEMLLRNSKKVVGAAILLSLISAQPVAAAGTVVKGFVEQNSNIYSEHNQIEKRYK